MTLFGLPLSGLAAMMTEFSAAAIHKLQATNLNFARSRRGQTHLVLLSGVSVAGSLAFLYYVSRLSFASHHVDTEEAVARASKGSESADLDSGMGDVEESTVNDSDEGGVESKHDDGDHNIADEDSDGRHLAGEAVSALKSGGQQHESTLEISFESETSATGDVSESTIDLDFVEGRVQDLVQQGKVFARRRQVSCVGVLKIARTMRIPFFDQSDLAPFVSSLQYVDAAAAYSEALELTHVADISNKRTPQVAALLHSRSLVYEKDGRVDLALKDLEDLIAINSSDTRARKRATRLSRLSDGAASRSPLFLKSLTLRRSKKEAK